jgi:Fur family ferric uptake transcriptional regulator
MERNTRQRTAIRDSLTRAGRPLLAQEVLEGAQADAPGVSIATVYRNLRSMVDEGELTLVVLPGENPRYELAGAGHHHHFQCLKCERVFEVEACPGDMASLAPAGFTVEDHDLTLYGRCRECGPPRVQRGAAVSKPAGRHEHQHAHYKGPGHKHR